MTGGRYREHPPSPALRQYVACYWTRASRTTETRVLPDGCVDIVLDLGASSSDHAQLVVGTMTRPLVVAPSAMSDHVAVRFHPGGAQPFFGYSMRDLTDRRVHLDATWPETKEWVERLREKCSTDGRARLLDELVTERARSLPPPEPRVRAAVLRIEESRGSVSVKTLSREVGVSRQHLARLFELHVGTGAKFFARVVRLKSILKSLQRVNDERVPPDWSRLAVELGFFDQSHLGADFRVLTGLTPSHFRTSGRVDTGRWQHLPKPS